MKAGEDQRKILIVLDWAAGHATAYVSGLIYRPFFLKNGWHVEYVDWRKTSIDTVAKMAQDVRIVYLVKVPSLELVKKLRSHTSARLCFYLSDALWIVSEGNEWRNLSQILSSSDMILTDNDAGKTYAQKFHPMVRKLAVGVPVEEFDKHRSQKLRHRDGKIMLGWVGSIGTVGALFRIKDALLHICRKYPQAELRVLGADSSHVRKPLGRIRYTCLPSYNEQEMIHEICDMDIGLFPAPFDMEEYSVRGPRKAMLYMAARIPVVCQRAAGDFEALIHDGINGMFAKSGKEWAQKLDLLVKDESLRRSMGENGYRTVKANYTTEHVFRSLENALTQLLEIGPRDGKVKDMESSR